MEADKEIFDTLFRYTKALSVALGYRDLMTRLHSERVRDLSVMVGTEYGLANSDIGELKISSSFHDIGKIGIPDKILLKPSSFDEDEWKIMKQHSEIGEQIILATEFNGSERAALDIRHHHEHFDGGGYPDGLAGESIPIGSRIISIADSYDAMAIVRPYHRARNHHEIMEIMHGETGKKFDPQLMEIFCRCIEQCSSRVE